MQTDTVVASDPPATEEDLMSFEPPQQPSPPPSPLAHDLPMPLPPAPSSTAPQQQIQHVTAPLARRTEPFTHIESPPTSPQLQPITRERQRAGRPSFTTQRVQNGHVSWDAYGADPHVVACISCNDFCVFTGSRGVIAREELGLDASSNDTFFTTVCSTCEEDRGVLWLRLEGGRSPPTPRQQYPETLHSSMLATWPLYAAVRDRFGVQFDERARQRTVLVTRSRDWWREGILTSDKSLVLMWRYDHERATMYERNPMPRKDQFFGGPQR